MQTVILAGGRGTRLAEDTATRPKPMIEIGGRPLLWHVMSIYAAHGHRDFLVACGYKGEVIKEYFHSIFVANSDFFVDLIDGSIEVLDGERTDWRVGVIDTGLDTNTGGRIRRLERWLDGDTFMVTYGDGVGDVDVTKLVNFHKQHGKLATVTAVRPPARFGNLVIESGAVVDFREKPQAGEGWINGGFFVFEPAALELMADDDSILEHGPLETLSRDGQLMAYQHDGFWQPVDTLREKQLLQKLWAEGNAPWKIW